MSELPPPSGIVSALMAERDFCRVEWCTKAQRKQLKPKRFKYGVEITVLPPDVIPVFRRYMVPRKKRHAKYDPLSFGSL